MNEKLKTKMFHFRVDRQSLSLNQDCGIIFCFLLVDFFEINEWGTHAFINGVGDRVRVTG
jgi:hypothetical protein